MRPKIPHPKRHRARGVSLPPGMEREALRRASDLEMSFSRYVQSLIRADVERRILRPLGQEVAS